jgi:multiple sugar transport system substrate-binding protein
LDLRYVYEQGAYWYPAFNTTEGVKVPDQNTQTTTMMGGWELAIPQTSMKKELAWEFLTLMIEPKVLVPMLEENGYLPTQLVIGEEPYLSELDEMIPYYKEMVSMVEFGRQRPSVAEYAHTSSY